MLYILPPCILLLLFIVTYCNREQKINYNDRHKRNENTSWDRPLRILYFFAGRRKDVESNKSVKCGRCPSGNSIKAIRSEAPCPTRLCHVLSAGAICDDFCVDLPVADFVMPKPGDENKRQYDQIQQRECGIKK